MTLEFKNEVKYNDNEGFLEVYDNVLKIITSKDNSEINFKDMTFVTLNQTNKNELIIGLNDNTTTHLYLLNSDKDYTHMINYINERIIKINSPQEITDKAEQATNDHIVSKSNDSVNQLQMTLPASILINKQTLYNYPDEAFIKEDLNGINYNIEANGELSVFDNFISLNTTYYELNLPYYMLNDITLKYSTHKYYKLKLNSGSLIQITPLDNNIKMLQKINVYIQSQIRSKSLAHNNLQTYPLQNYPIQQQNQQQYPQRNFQQNIPNNMPMNQKSKLIVFILHMIIPGLGYAYMGRWGKFIITPIAIFITLVIRNFFNQTLYYMTYRGGYEPGIPVAEYIILGLSLLTIVIWIYTLYNSITMVDKYNRGLPY